MYIYERDNWTDFKWDSSQVITLLESVGKKQGFLLGRLKSLGFDSQMKAVAENLTCDVVYSSEIEGIQLNAEHVRSSIARKLGIENVRHTFPSHYIDSVVNVMLEAMAHYNRTLTQEKLCAWQAAFSPTRYSDGSQIEVGQYRTHEEHIVSGAFGREKIHYIAPPPRQVPVEMEKFLQWFNQEDHTSPVIRSAIAHLWFVSIHPFTDGNGRLARILSEMLLARGESSEFRFYNVSSQINKDKNHYYDILERTQHGNGDVTEWLVWYAVTLLKAIEEAEAIVSSTLNKSLFWQRVAQVPMTERQVSVLNRFLDGYEAKITTKTWAALAMCSKDTAIRDIQDLISKNILCEDFPGAKRPSYSIVYDNDDLTVFFSNISIRQKDGNSYLNAVYKGKIPVHERVLPLDAERFARGDFPLNNLLHKYCHYLHRAR